MEPNMHHVYHGHWDIIFPIFFKNLCLGRCAGHRGGLIFQHWIPDEEVQNIFDVAVYQRVRFVAKPLGEEVAEYLL